MRTPRLALVIAVVATAGLLVPVQQAAARPAGGTETLQSVIVVLQKQADLSSVGAGPRAQRLARVEQRLRDHAARSQSGLLRLLGVRRRQEQVADVQPLWISNEIAIRATPTVLRELARRPDVRAIRPDAVVQAPAAPAAAATADATIEPNVALVNAPALWSKGYRGQGVVVASMDTGVDVTHPELASRWRGGTNSWFDPNGQHPAGPIDLNGHGTWTTGVMVGGSVAVAPDAKWVAVKIFNDRGSATTTNIHRGFQWLLDPDGNPATPDAPDVINDSWTMSSGACNLEFQPDLRNLRAASILPVFAAGNDGPLPGTIGSPADLPEAFAVGATDNTDALYPYSSRGPSSCTGSVAPALAAPGVDVRTTDLYGLYATESGTSMAAPHAAGALALLLSAFPDLPADRQAAALQNGAVDLGPPGVDGDVGYGRLDVAASYAWLAGSPDFAVSVAPTTQSGRAGTALTYAVNVTRVGGFAGDVTLTLSGLSATQASAAFSPSVVIGGAGTSQLVITTASTLPVGSYPFTVTGTNGAVVHTATATLAVTPNPDFALAASPTTRNVAAGAAATYAATVTPSNGFASTVSFSLSGLPVAVGTTTFTPTTVTGPGSAQLSIATSSTAPAGTYPLTLSAVGGGITHTAALQLVVSRPDFALTVSPSSASVRRGQSASYTLTVAAVGGFAGAVTVAVSGVPSGTSVTVSANPVTAPGSTTLRLRTSGSTPRGTYTVQVTGTASTVTHRITVTLVVR